jgi:peptidylprolyl isomerase
LIRLTPERLGEGQKRSNMRKVAIIVMFLLSGMFIPKLSYTEEGKMVVLETNRGVIKIKLFPNIAPKACENFMKLVEKGYYDGVIFHRVIKDFMIQTGDPTGTGAGGESIWGKYFEDEVTRDLRFDRPWQLAMANRGPNTNGSQFFITTQPAPHLNMRHTIFGEVVSGADIVKKIENTTTDASDKPKDEQKIIKAFLEVDEKKE